MTLIDGPYFRILFPWSKLEYEIHTTYLNLGKIVIIFWNGPNLILRLKALGGNETTDVRDKSVRDEWSLRDKFLDRDKFLWDRDRKDRDKTKLRDTDVTKFSSQQTVSWQ